jgi:hypothetical protein
MSRHTESRQFDEEELCYHNNKNSSCLDCRTDFANHLNNSNNLAATIVYFIRKHEECASGTSSCAWINSEWDSVQSHFEKLSNSDKIGVSARTYQGALGMKYILHYIFDFSARSKNNRGKYSQDFSEFFNDMNCDYDDDEKSLDNIAFEYSKAPITSVPDIWSLPRLIKQLKKEKLLPGNFDSDEEPTTKKKGLWKFACNKH